MNNDRHTKYMHRNCIHAKLTRGQRVLSLNTPSYIRVTNAGIFCDCDQSQ